MAYQKQTWEDLPSTNTPITASRLNHIEDGIESVETSLKPVASYTETNAKGYNCNYINNNLDNIKTNLGGIVLWTNESPTNNFAEQTITLSSDDYDVLEIFYKKTGTENNSLSVKALKGTNTLLFAIDLSLAMFCRETNYVSDTSLSFGNANLATLGGSIQTQNSRCIPLYIVGYKTGLFN